MTISEVSKKYQLTEDTIRYYEKVGLLPRVPRNKSGIRDFDETSCKWLEFVKCMRSSGMPIDALIKYINLTKEGEKTVKVRKELLINQRKILKQKQKDINDTIERLDYKISLYDEIEAGKRKDFFQEP